MSKTKIGESEDFTLTSTVSKAFLVTYPQVMYCTFLNLEKSLIALKYHDSGIQNSDKSKLHFSKTWILIINFNFADVIDKNFHLKWPIMASKISHEPNFAKSKTDLSLFFIPRIRS